MVTCDRREFLARLAAGLIVLPHAAPVRGQSGAAPAYDLLIAGGQVIDPAQKLSAVRDVAITAGKVARIDQNIPRASATNVLDAKGMIVSPGWIDMHVHVYDGVAAASIDADAIGIRTGVTTLVDAGSAGAITFAGFRKHVIDRSQTSVFALLNVSAMGFIVTNESYIDPKLIDPDAAIRVISQNRDKILGIKVRIDGRDETATQDLEILRRGRVASDATGVPILMHWTRDQRLLSMLKAGDIITHPFNPPRAGPDLLGPDGTIMPRFLELRTRGVMTDFAHGGHLLWATAEKAAAAGWFPDLISTDLHRSHIAPNGNVVDLATTMAKFLYLGMTIEQVVESVTANPVKALKFGQPIGTLEVGSIADATVFELGKGDIELLDSTKDKRIGHQIVRHVATVKGGNVVRASGAR
jgi:dihydroorotase